MRNRFVAFMTAVLVLGAWVTSQADRRSYVWTYAYQTMPKGDLELEHYLDWVAADIAERSVTSFWRQQFEIEYGLSERWDISIYQVFKQENSGTFKYDQLKLRIRYRLFDFGQLPLDPLLYLEWKRPSAAQKPNVLEGKIILARDFEKLNVAVNLIAERAFARNEKTKFEYTAGMRWEFKPVFQAGLETIGNFESGPENKISLGPTISLARGEVFMTLGALFGLSRAAEDLRIRYIIGVGL